MGEAVDHSFSQLTPADIRAMVAYLRSVPRDRRRRSAGDDWRRRRPPRTRTAQHADPRGKKVFEGACVSCHGWTGESAISPFATLTGAARSTIRAQQMSPRS